MPGAATTNRKEFACDIEIVFIMHRISPGRCRRWSRRYKSIVTTRNSQIHRLEDWGAANGLPDPEGAKAHYVLMNIECDGETLAELEHSFKFNDAVLRHLTIKMKKAVTTPSPMMKEEKSRSMNIGADDAETGRQRSRCRLSCLSRV